MALTRVAHFLNSPVAGVPKRVGGGWQIIMTLSVDVVCDAETAQAGRRRLVCCVSGVLRRTGNAISGASLKKMSDIRCLRRLCGARGDRRIGHAKPIGGLSVALFSSRPDVGEI